MSVWGWGDGSVSNVLGIPTGSHEFRGSIAVLKPGVHLKSLHRGGRHRWLTELIGQPV